MNVETRLQLQNLARHEFIKKMLLEICFDMEVCKIEGWNVLEFPKMIFSEIQNFYERNKIKIPNR